MSLPCPIDRALRWFWYALVGLLIATCAHMAWGVTNSLTITEKAGVTTTNYPIQIGRPFAQGEIANYPQVIVVGTPVTTQADVKSRWPDGSVKHAILTFLIPTLNANTTANISFRNQATGNNGGFLDTAGMLGAGYDFDATMALTNGSTVTASARTMLTANAYTYWLQGSVATSIILADHSATRAYDIGFDANKAFRPIFHATFWPTINKVRVRFIGENANTQALEDQTYALALTTGSASPTTVYTKATVTHFGESRWTKEFWIGGAPTAIAINHNLAYLESTILIPNYDTSKHPSESAIAAQYTAWTNASKDLYGAGNWQKGMPTTGGRPDIGPYPTWTVLWLYTGDARMKEMAFGEADLAAAWPTHIREGTTGRYFDRAHTVAALGHVLSLNARPTIWFSTLNFTYTDPGDLITPVGAMTAAASNGWFAEVAHHPDPFTPQYMLTGDYWYLEEAYFWMSWSATDSNPTNLFPWGRGPIGCGGVAEASQIRGQAWIYRTRAHVASLAPDVDAEQLYTKQLMDDATAIYEGQRNITTTAFNGNANWTWGHTTGLTWIDNLGVPPLHIWGSGGPAWVTDMIDPAVTKYAHANWEHMLILWGLGRAKELGAPTDALISWLAFDFTAQILDPGYSPYYIAPYRLPTVALATGNYFQTWAGVKTGYLSSFDPVATFNNYLLDPEFGYSIIAISAYSQISTETNGAAAWNWIATHSLVAPALNDNPKWAIIPRTAVARARPFPPHIVP